MDPRIAQFDNVSLRILTEYMDSDRAPEHWRGLLDLDGFLTALIVGPDLILPSEWLHLLWCGDGPNFASRHEVNSILSATVARHNQILQQLEQGEFAPLFLLRAERRSLAAEWAEGFRSGVGLRVDHWTPLFQDEEAQSFLYPLLALCSDERGQNLLGMDWERDRETIRKAPSVIPECIQEIYWFWKSRAPDKESQIRKGALRGWLSVCACGSRRPYMHCCGAN